MEGLDEGGGGAVGGSMISRPGLMVVGWTAGQAGRTAPVLTAVSVPAAAPPPNGQYCSERYLRLALLPHL